MNKPFKLNSTDINLLLTSAGRAPSGGNVQPWLVHINDNHLTVSLNPQKLGTILDVNNYGSHFALGAFSRNLEIAAQRFGLEYKTQLTNQDKADDFQIHYTFTQKNKPQIHPLYKITLSRDTNRQLHDGQLIENRTIESLKKLVTDNSKKLQLFALSTNTDKNNLAKILGKADLIRTKNTPLLKEMLSELRWNHQETTNTKDGIDIKTMELPGNVAKMLQLLAKFPAMAKTVPNLALEKQAEPMLKHSSHLCILSLNTSPDPLTLYHAGYVNQLLWLETNRLGLAYHPWTVLTFFVMRAKFFKHTAFTPNETEMLLKCDAQLKAILHLPSTHTPIFIFRLSYAKPPTTRSLRYPWKHYTTLSSP